ncbi:hypothetical protein MWU60_09035 [Yoonia sp. F2084L]|uniref:hypothetical protein n=1 Tax=Yoonia sp. F2084L TaxID=2926419 RepID=UPI001FF6DA70|nr:hypothetical protein [Yoonia sp. F2084L]MCK0095713.1 hypothetical protein [Yoonia sp. F2084L]
MKQTNLIEFARQRPLFLVLLGTITIALVKAFIDGSKLENNFVTMGNDDIMRLLTVRDWLAGQGWYDVRQYQMLPPEGLPLHWSRYIDVGIAAFIVPLSYVMPMATAEQVAAAIWPTLILLLTILAIGFGTRRVFETLPSCFAVLCVAFWPLTADLHMAAGNLDHHNVQLLMMIIVAFALIWPSRPIAAGVAGGVAAAFSLAIGLEGLPFIVGAGLAFFMRALFVATPMSRQLLVVFCITLGIASALLMMGQTAPSLWAQPVCDQLGTPTLALIAVAGTACIVPMAAHRFLPSTAWQLGATIGLTVIGVGLAWPLLSGCLDGPYGDLPLEVQNIISERIVEAKPGLVYLQAHTESAFIFGLPVVVALLMGSGLWLSALRSGRPMAHRDQAVGLLLILGLVGFAMMFVQMRTVIMAAPVVPIIGGVVVAKFVKGYLQRRDLAQGLAAIAIAVMISSPAVVTSPFISLMTKDQTHVGTTAANCRDYASLKALNDVPPAVVLTTVSFGPALIWATHHKGLSGPYHRSAAAFSNGIVPFMLESAEMAEYVRNTGATHLLLCRGNSYDSDFATDMANGGSADWLRPVTVNDDAQLLFEVLPR